MGREGLQLFLGALDSAKSIGDILNKSNQKKLFQEYTDPNTSLPRKNEIIGEIAPKEFFKLQQQKESDQSLQELIRIMKEQEEEEQLPTIQNAQASIEQQNQMGQFSSEIPDVNQLRQQLESLEPIQGARPQIGNAPQQQQQQVDHLDAQRAKAKRLQQAALLMSTKNPTVGNQFLQQSKELNADVRTEETNRAKIASAEITAAATNAKTAEKARQQQISQVLPIQQEAIKEIKATELSLKAFDDQLASVEKGEVDPFSGANFSKYLKSKGYDTLAQAFQTKGGALFATAGKEVITGGLKQAFGAKPLGVEFEAFENMLPQAGRNKEVNKLVIKSLKVPLTIDNEIAKFKMQQIKENPNISAIELNSKAFDYGEQVRDIVKADWEQEVRAALESQRTQRAQPSLFGNTQNTNAKLQSIWK